MKKLNLNIDEIKEMYLSGKSSLYISKVMKCSEPTIQKRLRELGIMRSWSEACKTRKYKRASYKDEDFFNEINTEEKAYWLGFLYADGCVYKKKLQISLAEKEPLEKFLKSINSNAKIGCYGKDNKYYSLHITSKKLTDDLRKHGCVSNKTFKLKPPNINSELIRHFIRGYFDGDGCIYFNKPIGNYIKPSVSIVGTIDILEYIKSHITHIPGLKNLKKRHKDRDNNIRYFRFEGKKSCLLFKKYLYENSSVFLQRKKAKFYSI